LQFSVQKLLAKTLLHDDDDDLFPFIIFLTSPVLDEVALNIHPMKEILPKYI